MPRRIHVHDRDVINQVVDINSVDKTLKFAAYATSNEKKLEEIKRILPDFEIIGKNLDIEEIQSLDPYKVVSHKAKETWRKNNYNPIIVEDTSLDIFELGNRPSPYIKDFLSEVEMRKKIVEIWLQGKGSAAVARVLFALYDGQDVHIREGKVSGKITTKLRGSNGFGWDDMFIPDGQKTSPPKTFAEMTDAEKDSFSMRRLALEDLIARPFKFSNPIFMLPEPYEQELLRIDKEQLKNEKAKHFAFELEALDKKNKENFEYLANDYSPIKKSTNAYFNRFVFEPNQKSLGLLLTDVDRSNIKTYENGEPVIWQMGPERRHLALVERADFFIRHQKSSIHNILDNIDEQIISGTYPNRRRERSKVIDRLLGIGDDRIVTRTHAINEVGYKKTSSDKNMSRTRIAEDGLYTKIGKYGRSLFGIGSMPPVSGWRDVLVTSAIAHMPVFTTRNSIFAGDVTKQIDLIKDAKETLNKLILGGKNLLRAERNIGAAMGSGNVEHEIANAIRLYEEAGVTLFRIYTINSDQRVIDTARGIRKALGDKVEIFAGQLVDKKQCLALLAPDIKVDALIFGHGGGRQCTSAINGMAVTTLEEVYDMIIDRRLDDTTVIVEGGVGTSVGGIIVLGVNGILYNQQMTRCTIETGDIFFEHKDGGICHPYHGSASAPTMIIESYKSKNKRSKMFASGRVLNIEGKPGYCYYSEKANSMTLYIDNFNHFAARTLADMGVESIAELITKLNNDKNDYLRIVSSEAKYIGSPYLANK